MTVAAAVLMNLMAILVAYLIGSVSFAVLVSKVMGLADPHTYGSGNPGATNILRTGNRKAAALTLLGDFLKGSVAVLLAKWLAPQLGLLPITIVLVGLAAFLGHLYPIFHRFAGGKGVATAAGVLLALNPIHGLATIATWVIIAYVFRYSSLAALMAAVFSPFYWVFLFGADPAVLVIVVMSVLLIWRHYKNIGKLLRGKESRIGAKPGDLPAAARRAKPDKGGRRRIV